MASTLEDSIRELERLAERMDSETSWGVNRTSSNFMGNSRITREQETDTTNRLISDLQREGREFRETMKLMTDRLEKVEAELAQYRVIDKHLKEHWA